MSIVQNILHAKTSKEVYSIAPTATVYEAIQFMSDKGIGALVVVENDLVVGVFSERDYTRKIALMDRSSKTTFVSEIMTHKVMSVSPSATIDLCLALMTDKHIRHLPVLDGEKLVGMISIGDLVKRVMKDQEQLIEQLQSYISQ